MNILFPDRLQIEALPKEELKRYRTKDQLYLVLRTFQCICPKLGGITVPEGTVTDFASIPAVVRPLIDDEDPDILYPAVSHDYLYSVGGKLPDGRVITRAQADQLLRDSMRSLGAPGWKVQAVYSAVWSWGWRHFGKGFARIAT